MSETTPKLSSNATPRERVQYAKSIVNGDPTLAQAHAVIAMADKMTEELTVSALDDDYRAV